MTKEETEKLKKALEDFLNAPQVDAKSVFLFGGATNTCYAIKAPELWEMLEPFARSSAEIKINGGALTIFCHVGDYQSATIKIESGQKLRFLCFPSYKDYVRCYLTLAEIVDYITTFSKRCKLKTIYNNFATQYIIT